jgi:hypothetical protein
VSLRKFSLRCHWCEVCSRTPFLSEFPTSRATSRDLVGHRFSEVVRSPKFGAQMSGAITSSTICDRIFSQRLRCVDATVDHHHCKNSGFVAESLQPLATG